MFNHQNWRRSTPEQSLHPRLLTEPTYLVTILKNSGPVVVCDFVAFGIARQFKPHSICRLPIFISAKTADLKASRRNN
jgi:hypothetical protein